MKFMNYRHLKNSLTFSTVMVNIQAVNYVETTVECEQWDVADSDSE